jgi:hypothetical protein
MLGAEMLIVGGATTIKFAETVVAGLVQLSE